MQGLNRGYSNEELVERIPSARFRGSQPTTLSGSVEPPPLPHPSVSRQSHTGDVVHIWRQQITKIKEAQAALSSAIEAHHDSLYAAVLTETKIPAINRGLSAMSFAAQHDSLYSTVLSDASNFNLKLPTVMHAGSAFSCSVDAEDEAPHVKATTPALDGVLRDAVPMISVSALPSPRTSHRDSSSSPPPSIPLVPREDGGLQLPAYGHIRSHTTFSLPTCSERALSKEVVVFDGFDSGSQSIASKWWDFSVRLITQFNSKRFTDINALKCLHKVWLLPDSMRSSMGINSKFFCLGAIDGVDDPESHAMEHVQSWSMWLQRRVGNPSSLKRILWELLGFCCLIYDMVTLPLEVFSYGDTDTAEVMRYVVSSYWLIDLIFNFFCGYMEDGIVVTDILRVWKRYLKGWFAVDLALVLIDWGLLLLNSSASTLAIARLAKAGRFIRVMRLLRVARCAHFLQTIMHVSGVLISEAVMSVLNMLGFLLLPLLVSHYIACGWYWIGELQEGESWVDLLEVKDNSELAMYVLCFHWAISQYTPAPNSVHPVTLTERTFTVGALLIGFILFTSFLGSVTSMVTASRMQTRKRFVEESQVRRFIRDNKISFRLSHQIVSITKQQRVLSTVLVERDVLLFKTLPDSILVRLHFEVYANHISKHPLLHQIRIYESVHYERACFVQLAHHATRSESHGRFSEIFNFGYPSPEMIFVMHGSLSYKPGYKRKRTQTPFQLGAGTFLCEPALWVDWRHQGYAVSPKWCNLVKMPMKEFCEAIATEPPVLTACRNYATRYVQEVSNRCGADVLYQIIKEERECKIPKFDDLGLNFSAVHDLAAEAFHEANLDEDTTEHSSRGWFRDLAQSTRSMVIGRSPRPSFADFPHRMQL